MTSSGTDDKNDHETYEDIVKLHLETIDLIRDTRQQMIQIRHKINILGEDMKYYRMIFIFITIIAMIGSALLAGFILEDNARIVADQYTKGYIDGVRDALQDPSGSLAKLACMKGEEVTISIDGEQFKLVCAEDQG